MKTRQILLNLALLSATVIIFLIGLELFLRAAMPQSCYAFPKGLYEADNITCYKLSTHASGEVNQPEYKVTYTTNSHGLRDSEYSYEKQPGTTRIVALGDSFQFGHGVEKEEIYTEVAEEILKSQGKKIEIINMGVPGYGQEQELHLLKTEGLKYRPDIIIVSFHTADIFDNIQPNCTRHVRQGYLVDNQTADERTLTFQLKLFLNQNLHSYCFAKNRYVNLQSRKYTGRTDGIYGTVMESLLENETPQMKKAWTRTAILLGQLSETAKFNNATLVLVSIPAQVQADPEILGAIKRTYSLEPIDPSQPSKRLKETASTFGIEVIDLLPMLTEESKKRKLYYAIDGHLNSQGQHEAGILLAQELSKRGLV